MARGGGRSTRGRIVPHYGARLGVTPLPAKPAPEDRQAPVPPGGGAWRRVAEISVDDLSVGARPLLTHLVEARGLGHRPERREELVELVHHAPVGPCSPTRHDPLLPGRL
jgi:hypothetical protein